MAVGGVNIGGGSRLPVNVRFQSIEPTEKKGIWVEGDFNKYPEVLTRNIDMQPAAVSPGSVSMSNLTLWMDSIETDNYFVFYTSGRQPTNYSGNYLYIFDKKTSVMRSNVFFFNEGVTPLVEGDIVYFPINGTFLRVLNAVSNTFTNVPYGSTEIEQSIVKLFPSVDPDYFVLFSTKSGFLPSWYKVRRSDFMLTRLPNPPNAIIPDDPYFMIGRDSLTLLGNKLYKINIDTLQVTDLGVPFSGFYMMYFSKDKKYLIYRGVGTDKSMRALDLKTFVSIPLGITKNDNGYRDSRSRGHNTLMTLSTEYNSAGGAVKFGWSDMVDEILPDMLLINTSPRGAYRVDLFSMNTGTKFPVQNAYLFINNQRDVTKNIYVQSTNEFIPLVMKGVIDK